MAYTYKLRRDFANQWTTVDPILAQGEPGYEFDTGKLKIGDGVKVWTALPYLVETTELQIHMVSKDNPHAVTKAQVGLADASNTSDGNKPVSGPQQTALDNLEARAASADLANRENSKVLLTRNADGTVATATDNLGRVTDQIVRGASGISGFRENGIVRSIVRNANGKIMEVT
jgi:hypothetical protein